MNGLITFPESVEIRTPSGEYITTYNLIRIRGNIFAVHHNMHAITNTDREAFGYIIYHEGFLYGYTIVEDDDTVKSVDPEHEPGYDYRLIFFAFIGYNENDNGFDVDELIQRYCTNLGYSFYQYLSEVSVHPSIRQKDAIQAIYEKMKREYTEDSLKQNPYGAALHTLSGELAKFYTDLYNELGELI